MAGDGTGWLWRPHLTQTFLGFYEFIKRDKTTCMAHTQPRVAAGSKGRNWIELSCRSSVHPRPDQGLQPSTSAWGWNCERDKPARSGSKEGTVLYKKQLGCRGLVGTSSKTPLMSSLQVFFLEIGLWLNSTTPGKLVHDILMFLLQNWCLCLSPTN